MPERVAASPPARAGSAAAMLTRQFSASAPANVAFGHASSRKFRASAVGKLQPLCCALESTYRGVPTVSKNSFIMNASSSPLSFARADSVTTRLSRLDSHAKSPSS